MPLIEKQQYRNTAGWVIGVVTLDRKGEEHGIAVEPDGTVWLSEDERRLTARAPKRDEDNPFVSGALTPVGEGRVIDSDTRPIDAPAPQEETAAPQAPEGKAPEGSFAEGEEVATPVEDGERVTKPGSKPQTAQAIRIRNKAKSE